MDTADVAVSKMLASITSLPGLLSHAAKGAVTVGVAKGASGQGVAVVNLIISLAILLILFLLLPWRRLRWPLPMPWDIFRQVSFANLRMVSPTIHPLDNEQLEVTLLEPQKFRDVKSEDTTLPLQELLEWVAQHPFTGYKGGIARLVAKILWLDAENPDLQSEIQGFNDIDLIYFLQDGDEQQKTAMKKLVDDGLTIGGIPVEAQDVEYSYDTIPHVLATRDLTQNQCIIVSDASGRVFLITAQVCRQHMLQSKTAPAVASDNSTLDDYGNVVAKPRAVGRAIIQWMKGRASTVELNDATVKFYRKQKLPKMTLFQVFNKAKGNEMYMKVYTELLRLGFVEHQQFPHALWGDCYCYVNSLIARHGYRLELESDLDSAAVEKWKEAKYAEQLARTRISIFRDFRFHRMVLDETFLMPYEIADTPLTAGLKEHMAGQLEHPSREHLTRLRRLQSRTSMQLAGGSLISSTTRFEQTQPGTTFRLGGSEAADSASRLVRQAAHEKGKAKAAEIIQRILSSGGAYLEQDDLPDDQRDPLLNQNMFGKLTMTETFLHLLRVVKIAWVQFLLSFLVNLFAAVLFVLVINHMASAFWLLAAFASNALGAWLFIRASNCALLNVLSSMFLALLNLRADAFSTRLFSEVWSRLVGDTRALQGVLESCSDFTIEALTAIGALFVLLFSMEPSCDNSIWSTMLVVVSTGTGMAAISMLAGFSLRSSSRMSRSMIGYLYSYMFSSLSNFFETKFIPEQFAATTSAYEEIQSASLEQRKKLTLIHQVVSIFLRVTEFAALTQALYRLVHSSSTDASCLHSYSIQAMSIPILLSAVRRASEACLQLFSSVGSLERLFLLSRALLRFSTPRFDGINHFAAERISMEIPHDFNVSLGSPQFGPFARIPALPEVKVGKLNVLAMARGQGASTLAKILLRIVDAPARIKIDGEHVEQYEQETLNFAIHVVDHPPLASSVARTAGQGQSLTEYVQLGLEDNGMGLPLDVCLHRAGIWSQVANIPHGIECTEWSSYMTKPEAYRVQLARALFRASLGTLRMSVVMDPLRHCNRSELPESRRLWQDALRPLLKDVLVLVVDQTSEPNAWSVS